MEINLEITVSILFIDKLPMNIA